MFYGAVIGLRKLAGDFWMDQTFGQTLDHEMFLRRSKNIGGDVHPASKLGRKMFWGATAGLSHGLFKSFFEIHYISIGHHRYHMVS